MQIGGIILAGGESRRMGADKALLVIEGKTLLEHAISISKTICSEIVISTNSKAHSNLGYKTIPDVIPGCGPLGGIYSALQQSDFTWNLVLSVDTMYVESEFITAMLSKAVNEDAVIPIHKNGKEPLVAIYNKSALHCIEEQLEQRDYKLYNLLERLNAVSFKSDVWLKKYPRLFSNLNRPEDIS